jgi:hypothetical protein
MTDKPATTPLPKKIANARSEENRLSGIEGQLDKLQTTLDLVLDGRYCPHASEIKVNSDHRRGLGALGLVLTAALIGAFVTIGLSCEQHNEQDAETRALVAQNARDVAKLENSVSKVSKARDEDIDRIIKAVDAHEAAPARPAWCKQLTRAKRRQLARLIGVDPCSS